MDKKDLSKLIRTTQDSRERLRYIAIAHFQEGKTRTEISSFLKVSRNSINKWVAIYQKKGLAGLKNQKRSGRPSRLTEEQKRQLKDYVVSSAVKPDGGRLQASDIILYIENEFAVTYGTSGVYRILHSLRLSWVTTRSKHPKQCQEEQEVFKKLRNS